MAKLLCFEREDRCDRVKSMAGQCYVDAGRSLRDLERLSGLVGEQVCADNLAWTLVEVEAACRPGEKLNVDAIGGGRGTPVPRGDKFRLALLVFFGRAKASRLIPEESRLSAVDGFAVYG